MRDKASALNRADDDLLRRFLVGDLPEEERERIEQAFMHDPASFEALLALEQDMLLSYARNELAEPWRSALRARLDESPALRRELDSTRTLQSALAASRPRHTSGRAADSVAQPGDHPIEGHGRISTAKRPLLSSASTWWGIGLGTAAAAALLALGIRWSGESDAPAPASSVATAPAPPSAVVATFLLQSGVRAADGSSSNSFRIPPGTDQIQLQLTAPPLELGALEALVRRVGGAPLPATGTLTSRRTDNGLELSWVMPARELPPGDYILTIVGRTPETTQPLASRFFSILP